MGGGGAAGSRKTTNRLRAIETLDLVLGASRHGRRVARQLIAFGRLKPAGTGWLA